MNTQININSFPNKGKNKKQQTPGLANLAIEFATVRL